MSLQQLAQGYKTPAGFSPGKLTHEQAMDVQRYIMDTALAIIEDKRHDYSGGEDPFRNFRKSALFPEVSTP